MGQVYGQNPRLYLHWGAFLAFATVPCASVGANKQQQATTREPCILLRSPLMPTQILKVDPETLLLRPDRILLMDPNAESATAAAVAAQPATPVVAESKQDNKQRESKYSSATPPAEFAKLPVVNFSTPAFNWMVEWCVSISFQSVALPH